MPNVRRGGRWANVRSGRRISSSNHQTDDDHAGMSSPRFVFCHCALQFFLLTYYSKQAVHQSLLCFLLEKNALGVASYNIHTNDIHISKFVPSLLISHSLLYKMHLTLPKTCHSNCRVSTEGNYTNVVKIIMALEQTTVILSKSSKENESFLNAIHAGFRDSDAQQSASGDASHVVENESSSRRSTENQRGELNISYLPNNEFSRVKAIELISLVSILGMPPNLTRDRRASFLVHILGEDDCVIRAVGGLLSFIVQHDILRAFGAESDSIHINAIHERNFCDVVSVSPTTLRALHVFHLDTHPVGRGSMQAKEGLSLFGILKVHIKTASARAMLRAWLMYPSTDTEKITQRQVMVRFLKGNENSAVLATLKDALRGVRNVPGVLSRFRKASASINDWKALFSSVKAFVVLLETLKLAVQQNSDIADSPLLKKANKVDESHLRETVNWIETIVDFEDSTAAGRMVVANGFSSRIDDLKRSYGGLDDFLSRIGAQELTRLLETENPLPLSTMQFTYKPQIGYLIALSEEECEEIGLKKFGEHGLSFMYSSFKDGLYFFKNERCNELDREIGDIHSAVIDLEAEAFRFLENKILDFSSTLYETASIICELDCLQALACSSKDYGWNMPEVSGNSQVLDIDDGRHALLELSVPCFIPNSTKMKHGDVHIVTGCVAIIIEREGAFLLEVHVLTIFVTHCHIYLSDQTILGSQYIWHKWRSLFCWRK